MKSHSGKPREICTEDRAVGVVHQTTRRILGVEKIYRKSENEIRKRLPARTLKGEDRYKASCKFLRSRSRRAFKIL